MTKRSRRGSTLIEVMAASVILLIGMTGITALLIRGMSTHREVNVELRAMNYANSRASQLASLDYNALTPSAGTTIDPVTIDEDGRPYVNRTIITEVGDGGIGAVRVEVHSVWQNFLRQNVDAVAVTIVSEVPDAN